MGCVSSQHDINDTHSNIFVVQNIDDSGIGAKPSNMEITDRDVILHQKGADPVIWSLKCLKRYGADMDIFSFESGRKCQTGSGIYAFRCNRAGKLLEKLQISLKNNSENARAAAAAAAVSSAPELVQSNEVARQQSLDSIQQQELATADLSPQTPASIATAPASSPAVASAAVATAGDAESNSASRPACRLASNGIITTGTATAAPNATTTINNNHIETGVEEDANDFGPKYANVYCKGASAAAAPATTSFDVSDGYLVPTFNQDPLSSRAAPVSVSVAASAAAAALNVAAATDSNEYENVGLNTSARSPGLVSIKSGGGLLDHHPPVPPRILSQQQQQQQQNQQPPVAPIPMEQLSNGMTGGAGFEDTDASSSPKINYIAVDFESVPPASPGLAKPTTLEDSHGHLNGTLKRLLAPSSPPEIRGEYCTIDIDRTKALCTTAQQQHQRTLDPALSNSPVGVRKTRHNSTLADLPFGLSGKRSSVVTE